MDVADWLRALGLQRYEATFRAHDITAAVLPSLSAEDLKDVGVTLVGHRLRLLDAIAALRGPRQLTQFAAERRQITVMFCDVMDFTPLSSRLDPEDLSTVIHGYQSCVASTIARFGGFIARYVGDGVLIYFGWPEAHETDAERAVRAGLTVIAAIGQMSILNDPLHIRIGIATGLVVIGAPIGTGEARQQTAMGETPNLAARLQALAGADGLVIDQTTRRQLGSLFDCRDLGRLELKGFAEPVPAWKVLGERLVGSRFEALHTDTLAPMVGRDAELDLLVRCWQCARQGEGQVLLVSGEAGIGKSRLIAALEDRLQCEAPTRLRYFCSPDQTDTALHPLIASLQHEAGFAHGDTDVERLCKLRSRLALTATTSAGTALIAELLSIPSHEQSPVLNDSPQARKQRTFDTLIERVRMLAQTGPLLVILEDAHWADASSIEFFDALIPTLRKLPALLIISTRDEGAGAWTGQERISMMSLARLDRRQAAALAAGITAHVALPPGLLERIVDQTDGIPLFVEELTKTVVETAPPEEPGGGPAPLAVPSSLQASLMSRLDRIPAAKEVAQVGALFGREFPETLLTAIAGLPASTLLHGLQQLVDAGLASKRGTSPDASYSFKHALVRDTAYGMLLRSRRRALHANAAAALEEQSPELRERQPELLAHHYTQAGLAEPAIDYWTRAGRRSVARSAMVEAVAQLRQALELVPELPEGQARNRQEMELQATLGGVLFAVQAWSGGRAARAYARAQELAEKLGDVETTVRVLAGFVHYHMGQCRYREAREIAVNLVAIADREAAPSAQLIAHRCMGVSLHWSGEFAGALKHFDRVLALYDPARDRQLAPVLGFDLGVQAAVLSCWDLLILGRPDQALARFEQATSQFGDVEHKHSRVFALGYGGIFSLFLGDRERALSQLAEAFELASEQHFAAWEGISSIVLGANFTVRADGARGLEQARAGYARYAAANGAPDVSSALVLNGTYYLGLLALACESAGASADALVYLDSATDSAARSGERWFGAELYRLKGEWLLCHAPSGEVQAETAFREAIDLAAQQGALLWQLRASMSLARVFLAHGELGRARDALAPVYAQFSEGFDRTDLQQAAALLHCLAA